MPDLQSYFQNEFLNNLKKANGASKLNKTITWNNATKLLNLIALGFLIHFCQKIYSQVTIAQEYMQLAIDCDAKLLERCEELAQQSELLLGSWHGDLSNDFLVYIFAWIVFGASFLYLSEKSSSKA